MSINAALNQSIINKDQRNDVVVRASILQSVNLSFTSLVESYQKTLNKDVRRFPVRRWTHQ